MKAAGQGNIMESTINAETPRPLKTARQWWRWKYLKNKTAFAIIAAGAAVMILPIFWMVSTSLKEPGTQVMFPPEWLPKSLYLQNYSDVVQLIPLGTFFLNSVHVATFVVFAQLLTCSMAGYAFAKLRFPGRDIIFFVLLAAMMLPGEVTIIPVFLIMNKLGWVGSHKALIAPAFFGGVWNTFLFRQFFLTIPNGLEDAARLDGASPLRVFTRIILPLSKPVLATVAIFTFMGSWNDFFSPLIYLNRTELLTLPVGLTYLNNMGDVELGLLMAAAVLAMLPLLIVYFIGQRYFMEGITLTGMKE